MSMEYFNKFKDFIVNQENIDIVYLKMYWMINVSMDYIYEFTTKEAVKHKNKELHINMSKVMQDN